MTFPELLYNVLAAGKLNASGTGFDTPEGYENHLDTPAVFTAKTASSVLHPTTGYHYATDMLRSSVFHTFLLQTMVKPDSD